jgi:hypothetical protein
MASVSGTAGPVATLEVRLKMIGYSRLAEGGGRYRYRNTKPNVRDTIHVDGAIVMLKSATLLLTVTSDCIEPDLISQR